MRELLCDLLESFKYSLKVFLIIFIGCFLVGIVTALFKSQFEITYIIEITVRIGMYISCFGLFISGISFVSNNTMRPLDYQEQWETYFKKMNLSHVIFFISVFCLVYFVIIESLLL